MSFVFVCCLSLFVICCLSFVIFCHLSSFVICFCLSFDFVCRLSLFGVCRRLLSFVVVVFSLSFFKLIAHLDLPSGDVRDLLAIPLTADPLPIDPFA